MIIMEMTNRRMEEISEYAEKVLRYAGRLMSLIDEHADGSDEDYDDDDRRGWRYGERRHRPMR